MAITDTINQIKAQVSQAYTILESYGATIPEDKNLENLSATIQSVSLGDGEQLPLPEIEPPESVVYDFDNLQSSFTIPLLGTVKDEYLNGDLVIFADLKVVDAGWPIGDGGNLQKSYSWNKEVLNFEVNIWNNNFTEYQIVFDAFKDGYKHLTQKIPVDYTIPQRVGMLYHLLDTDGLAVDGLLTVDNIEIIEVSTGEIMDKKYVRQEEDYWTDTFYMTLMPDTEYQMKVTVQGTEYTSSFTPLVSNPGGWSSDQLWFLPTFRVFSIYPKYQNADASFITNINSASAIITQFTGDEQTASETVFLGTNEEYPDQIYKEMNIGIDRYQVELGAPYFNTEVMSLTETMKNGRYYLTPSFDTNTKRCYILGAHYGDGWVFESKISLNETNTTIIFSEEGIGEYTFVNGFLTFLVDIGKTVTITIEEDGYEPVNMSYIFGEEDPACRSVWYHMNPITEEV